MTTSPSSFADLDLRLRRAAADVDVVLSHIDVTEQVLAAVRPHVSRTRRWPAIAAATAVLLGTATLAIPSARAEVARWFGVGGAIEVRIEPFPGELPTTIPSSAVPVSGPGTSGSEPGDDTPTTSSEPDPAPGSALFGEPMTAAEAEALTGLVVPAPGALGPPDAIYIDDSHDRIVAVYAPTTTLPGGVVADVGAIVEVIRGQLERGLYVKFADQTVETRVGEADALFVTGPSHPLAYVDDRGEVIVETARLAGPTLVWDDAGVTYRLESDLHLDAAVALAASIP